MVKKISTLALAGLLALPAVAFAGAGGAAGTSDIQAQVDALTRQLEQLKSEMAKVKAAPVTDQSDRISALEDRSETWDLASRIQWSGDFRSRADFYTRDRTYLTNTAAVMGGAAPVFSEVTDKNNSMMTNRMRLDLRAKALENVEFKGRLAMYKTWGHQDNPAGLPGQGGAAIFDGNATRQPSDSILRVDR
ncbi:MAG: DUF3373 domain-containing protein, partial [Proteobacteria bacterium]|nr:DUF3373 domain-containing protein [Pseudomonadota bacterium]